MGVNESAVPVSRATTTAPRGVAPQTSTGNALASATAQPRPNGPDGPINLIWTGWTTHF